MNPAARLIAVSKGQDARKIRDLYQLGQREFGENYVDELEVKSALLLDLPDIRWIFIGQLQSNKIQRIVRVAAEIQSAASEKHLRYIDRHAREMGRAPYPVFIEANIEGEETKGGVDEATLGQLLKVAGGLGGIALQGLMAIPPADISDQDFHDKGLPPPESFCKLRRLADAVGLGKLSLGMSGDFRTALAAGSDCVRIGRALFGERS
jgi:pyridoxal phosphate enzyme (YggS family)